MIPTLILSILIFIEGEFSILGYAILCKMGVLTAMPDINLMVLATILCFASDTTTFAIGKRVSFKGKWDQRLNWVADRFKGAWFIAIPILRFQIGLRTLGHLAMGRSQLSWPKYLLVEGLSSVAWGFAIPPLIWWFTDLMAKILTI